MYAMSWEIDNREYKYETIQDNCRVCNDNEVIYSGVDAFVLGVVTEKVCYNCANVYNQVKNIVEKEIVNHG